MISFKYNEIPNGKSEQTLEVRPSDLELTEIDCDLVRVKVRFNKSENSTLIDFDTETVARFTCDRSLEIFEQTIRGSYSVLYKSDGEAGKRFDEEAYKVLRSDGHKLDITTEVRDTIMLHIPIKKLHPRFLDDSGEPTDFSESFSDGETTDPRWEALKKLRNN